MLDLILKDFTAMAKLVEMKLVWLYELRKTRMGNHYRNYSGLCFPRA